MSEVGVEEKRGPGRPRTSPAVPQSPEAMPPSNGDSVSVACKIPNGLILRVGRMVHRLEPILGGGSKEVKQWEADGRVVYINGPGRHIGEDPKCPISGGYAITHGVDASFWARWLKDNSETDLVKNGQIFASDRRESISRMAVERRGIKSGLEPIVPDTDPRIPKPKLGSNLSAVGTATRGDD